jgi:Xaa-Pro aminopeptidase
MDLQAIQRALREAGIDGWLFFDLHHRDPIAYRILGLDTSSITARRWFYLIPASGPPTKLAHRVEPRKLDALPGSQEHYLAWTELHEKLGRLLAGMRRVAMQYSPLCNIPTVSLVDAGTLELVRSRGVEVVSSADLVQRFEAVTDEAGFQSHADACEIVHGIKDEAFDLMRKAIHDSGPITEYDVHRFILARFEEQGLTSDGEGPIVGFNDHPADPHFEPKAEGAYRLHHGDTILLDLWARRRTPPGIYYDITWCGFAGERPPALYVDIWNAVCRARDAALELVTERFARGEPCRGFEVDQVARRVVTEAGFGASFLHRTGHSIGRTVHGTGANLDDLETKDERLLVPGTCFSIEPGIYLEGRMAVRTEIDVFLRLDGKVEVCGPIQRDLVLIG